MVDIEWEWACLERSGHSLFVSYRNESAERVADTLLSRAPARTYGYYLKGEVYRRRRCWTEAIQWFERAIHRGKAGGWSEYRIAECFYQLGQYETAQDWTSLALHALEISPALSVAANSLARAARSKLRSP